MRLSRDAVYRLLAIAKGDLPADVEEQRSARRSCDELVDSLTQELQQYAPGNLTITHQSVRETLEEAYREYRRRTSTGT